VIFVLYFNSCIFQPLENCAQIMCNFASDSAGLQLTLRASYIYLLTYLLKNWCIFGKNTHTIRQLRVVVLVSAAIMLRLSVCFRLWSLRGADAGRSRELCDHWNCLFCCPVNLAGRCYYTRHTLLRTFTTATP